MPDDGEAWRRSLAALDADAAPRTAAVRRARPSSSRCDWSSECRTAPATATGTACRPSRSGALWTRYACAAFYSHPWAWNEIGFGGPAYPRGYKNLGLDQREPWEVAERRRRRSRSRGRDGPSGAARRRHDAEAARRR